jgi:KDO2-lipid IV(A) lauroyltransferase
MVGILPDQRPRGGEGVDAPMFGLPRRTMTLFGRLAERSGAAVVFAFAERLPRGDGFRIHVLPSPPGIADADAQVAAAALNQGIAACVERAVDQYQWTYKIYGYWEPGAPPNRFYDDPIAADPSEAGSA